MQISRIDSFRVPPRWTFVRVVTDDGREGWGESIVPKRPRAVAGAIEDLADNLLGADPNRIEDLWQRMRRGAFFRGGPILATAAAGIEHALWDLKGRLHDLPAHQFLGGPVRERIRAYAWVGGDSPKDVVDQVRARVEQGFTAVKMNATAQLDYIDRHAAIDAVVERMRSIRAEFGRDLGVALDFHGRVHRAMAKPLLRELEQFHPMWVEEPVPPEHEEALREVARVAGATPIATGERLASRWEFKRLLHDGAADIVQPDVSLTGLFELEKICRMAEAYDIAVAPHCPNGPISLAASLQVGSCCTNVVIQEQSHGIHYHRGYMGLPRADMYEYLADRRPLEPREGYFDRPDGPGLGISVDGRVVEEASAREWRLHDADWRHEDGRLAEW